MVDFKQIKASSLVVAAFALTIFSGEIHAAGGGAIGGDFAKPALNDVGNQHSLRRGARNFMNYCSGCHSAKYVRYNTLADGLDLSEDQVIENLMFNGEKMHQTIQANMPDADAERWFGVAPPDLSLIARSRGSDYLYNFLRGFYLDDSRPNGVNNLVLPGASMPHVLWELQGEQIAVFETDDAGHEVFRGFEQVTEGSLSPEEYDRFVRDTVNFLDYIGEPMQLERRTLGVRVLMFLFLFLIIAIMLKKEVWKDVR